LGAGVLGKILAPESEQGGLVATHGDPRIAAAKHHELHDRSLLKMSGEFAGQFVQFNPKSVAPGWGDDS
jgi:hypothetical protein